MYISPGQRVFIFLAVSSLAIAGYALVYQVPVNLFGLLPAPSENANGPTNGLTHTSSTAEDITGTLYFVGARDFEGERSNVSYAHRVSLSGMSVQTHVPALTYSFIAGARGFDFLIAQDANLPLAQSMQPAVYDPREQFYVSLDSAQGYRVRHLAISPNELLYAYAYQDSLEADPFDINQWNIAIHNFESGLYEVIEGATKPQFAAGGQEVYFIEENGLAMYDIPTNEVSPLTDQFTGLSPADDFVITADGRHAVMTIPTLNLISIQERQENGSFTEKGRIVASETRYYHPLISPDGQYYATVAAHYNKRGGEVEKTELQFRHLEGVEALKTVEVTDFAPESLEITSWQSE